MPTSKHVLALLALQAVTVVGALSAVSAAANPPREAHPHPAVVSSVRPVTIPGGRGCLVGPWDTLGLCW